MTGLSSFIIQYLPIASIAAPLILGGGFLWLKDKFPTKADFQALRADLQAQGERTTSLDQHVTNLTTVVKRLENERDDPPTRIHLLEEMSSIAARMSAVEARTAAMERQQSTANEYLQLLVERGLR